MDVRLQRRDARGSEPFRDCARRLFCVAIVLVTHADDPGKVSAGLAAAPAFDRGLRRTDELTGCPGPEHPVQPELRAVGAPAAFEPRIPLDELGEGRRDSSRELVQIEAVERDGGLV